MVCKKAIFVSQNVKGLRFMASESFLINDTHKMGYKTSKMR